MIVARIPFRARQIAYPRPGSVVVSGVHQVREAHRRHVAGHALAAAQHHRHDPGQKWFAPAERLCRPFACDGRAGQGGIPGEAAKGIPVRLIEVAATPVAVRSGIGHARHSGRGHHLRHRAAAPGIGVQHLGPHWCQEGQVAGETQILLGDLHFQHQPRIRHCAEHRMERLARLEIDGAVLHLHDHVAGKSPVQRHEFLVGLARPVGLVLRRIDEGAPDHRAALADGLGQHVRTVGVSSAIVLRAGLALTVGFYKEPAEIGYGGVDLVGLVLPPLPHRRVQRIGGVQPADIARGAEACGEIDADAVRAPGVCKALQLGDIARLQHEGRGVHVVHHGTVDTDRSVGAGVIDHPLIQSLGQMPPVEDRAPGVAAFHVSVRIVPMIEKPQGHGRGG